MILLSQKDYLSEILRSKIISKIYNKFNFLKYILIIFGFPMPYLRIFKFLKTKRNLTMIEILCTVGPKSINKEFLSNLKGTRVTTLRINLSHTKINEVKKVYKKIRKYSKLPICLDTEGAQIRTSLLEENILKLIKMIRIEKKPKLRSLNLYPDIYRKLKKNHILEIGFENLIIKIKEFKKDYCLAKVISIRVF